MTKPITDRLKVDRPLSVSQLETESGQLIATMNYTRGGALDDDEAEATARRLAACWNACEGIATESIQADGPGGVHRVLSENILAMQQMCDALRLAVRNGESRLYLLRLHGSDHDRQVLTKELATYRDALAYAEARMPQKNTGNSGN